MNAQETSQDSGSDDARAGAALFRLVRMWARRRPPEAGVLVVQAFGPDSAELRIGDVAQRLFVAPSTASRMVGTAEADGYVVRGGDPGDGRATGLALTGQGEQVRAAALAFQRDTFARATADWSEAERTVFARDLVRFVDAMASDTGAAAGN